MSPRVIDPPLADLDRLANPLNSGERLVIDFFDEHLPLEWELYVQPRLNGLRPDLVLLNPAIGVSVFEVKDWNLDALDYYVDNLNGRPELAARSHEGRPVDLSGDVRNPLAQVMRYKEAILNLYCPRLGVSYRESTDQSHAEGRLRKLLWRAPNGEAVDREPAVTAGLIFTGATTDRIRALLGPLAEHQTIDMLRLHPISGFNDLRPGRLSVVFPGFDRSRPFPMSGDLAEDLRGWLREPAFSREQRTPPDLDANQRRIAATRTETGFRRVKGPAGSGKTVALAARAAELAAQEQRVLVCTFNITLMNYIRDLIRQYARTHRQRRPEIEIYNFHDWCRRVARDAGRMDEYRALWDRYNRDEVFDVQMASLAESIWRGTDSAACSRPYDAILVDEGQDFRLGWWAALRAALAEGGEMLLVADKTQNVFGTARAWTDAAMPGAGFRGDWLRLERSYRLPPRMMPMLKSYAEHFMIGEEVDLPTNDQGELDIYPVQLKWVQATRQGASRALVAAVLDQMRGLQPRTAASDIIVLGRKRVTADVVKQLEQLDVRVRHTFDDSGQPGRERQLKLDFFQGAERVKATTLHSFKGWEAVQLVVYVDSVASSEDRAVFYAALTRIKRRELGSALTVVCSTPDLNAYGRTWPDFKEFVLEPNAP